MGLTYRSNLDRPLNTTEIDDNFRHFTGSHAVTGSVVATGGFIGSLTGSVSGSALTAETASYVSAANVDGIVANATVAVTSSFAAGAFLFAAVNPLPTPVNGALIVSSSGDLYFGSGSSWNLVSL